MTPPPTLAALPRELREATCNWDRLSGHWPIPETSTHPYAVAYRAAESALVAYVERLQRENELRARQVDRYIPCADHRDKVREGECVMCRLATTESRLRAVEEERRALNEHHEQIAAGLALLFNHMGVVAEDCPDGRSVKLSLPGRAFLMSLPYKPEPRCVECTEHETHFVHGDHPFDVERQEREGLRGHPFVPVAASRPSPDQQDSE